MSTASNYFDPPIFRTEHLERLAAFGSPAEIGDPLWNEVHDRVQRVLGRLDEPVRSIVPHVNVTSGRTQGRSFYLFTYRTYSRTDAPEIDPVVVGLTLAPADHDARELVVIDADISGESTGDGIERLPLRTVRAVREELLLAVHETAFELSHHGQRIAESLLDSSRSI